MADLGIPIIHLWSGQHVANAKRQSGSMLRKFRIVSNDDDDDYSGEDWWPLLSLSEQSALLAETDREWAAITKRGHNLNKKAYMRGRAFEERGMRWFKDRGWFAIRSFASLGPVDYLAYKNGVGCMVQAKWSGYRDTGPEHFVTEAAGLADLAKLHGGDAVWQGVIRKEKVGAMTFWYWTGKKWDLMELQPKPAEPDA